MAFSASRGGSVIQSQPLRCDRLIVVPIQSTAEIVIERCAANRGAWQVCLLHKRQGVALSPLRFPPVSNAADLTNTLAEAWVANRCTGI